jgi:iron complex transport system substrate-binding protein
MEGSASGAIRALEGTEEVMTYTGEPSWTGFDLPGAFADVEGWAQIEEEQVIARDPDYIVTITMYYGEGPTPVEEIAARPGWEGLKAVQQGHILNADSNEISRPGPRLKDAVLQLFNFVHGAAEGEVPAA